MTNDTYDRQKRIPGWDQDKLKDADVSIIGSGTLAQFTAAVLAGLGIGFIKIFSNEKVMKGEPPEHFLTTQSQAGSYRVHEIAKMVNKINSNIACKGIVDRLTDLTDCDILGAPAAIIDCTNNPFTELAVFDYGKVHNVSVINGNSAKYRGTIACIHRAKSRKADDGLTEKPTAEEHAKIQRMTKEAYLSGEEYASAPQDAITSAIISGLIADEVRKLLVPLEGDSPLIVYYPIEYNLLSSKRFKKESDLEVKDDFSPKKRLLQIGAGSIGSPVGLLAAILGYENTIIDNDTVEVVNLNRQIMLYDKVGEPKSKGLAENLQLVNPQAKISYVHGLFDANYGGKEPDVILDCVDKVKSRLSMDAYVKARFAKGKAIPIISGGTSFKSGQVVSVVPGQTICFNHARGLDALIEKEVREESCRTDPNPSVIISNWIAGALMMAELYALFHFQPQSALRGSLEYAAGDKERIRIVSSQSKCNCYEEAKNGRR